MLIPDLALALPEELVCDILRVEILLGRRGWGGTILFAKRIYRSTWLGRECLGRASGLLKKL